MSLLEQLEVVRRVLSAMGEGEELEHAGEKHSIALCVAFQRVKTLKTDEKLDLIVAIEGLRMGSTAKGRLLAQVRGKCEATSRKRPLQDYVSWPNFCTPLVWRDISDNPQLATEILCQQLNSLGLILPSKDTEKSIAAHAIAGEYGQLAASVSEEDATRVFKGVGKRIRQLYKAEPSEFIAKLPPSPAVFLKLHPTLAKAVFSRENLPCACPLDRLYASHAESKIRLRGGDLSDSSPQDVNQGGFYEADGVHDGKLASHGADAAADTGADFASARVFVPGGIARSDDISYARGRRRAQDARESQRASRTQSPTMLGAP